MYYHAVCRIVGGHQVWPNRSLEAVIREVVGPFLGKHVREVSYDRTTAIMNLGAVTYLRVFCTEDRLPPMSAAELVKYVSSRAFSGRECTRDVIREARVTYAWREARSVLQQALSPLINQFFVVMKFDDQYLDWVYRNVIRPTAEGFGYRVLRIDEVEDSGRITEQLLTELGRSRLVFCDLTGERPNCYYETGFAHALGRELILSVRKGEKGKEDGTHIHFDLASHRFIVWDGEEELRDKLSSRLSAIKKHEPVRFSADGLAEDLRTT